MQAISRSQEPCQYSKGLFQTISSRQYISGRVPAMNLPYVEKFHINIIYATLIQCLASIAKKKQGPKYTSQQFS